MPPPKKTAESKNGTNNGKNKADPISEEISQRVCKHMNGDHAVTVYAMAKARLPRKYSGFKISSSTLKRVTSTTCEIRVVLCKNDICKMDSLVYPIRPALFTAAQVRPRMVAIHRKECAPQTSWLVTKPLALLIVAVCSFLAYATIWYGLIDLEGDIESVHDWLHPHINLVFGSPRLFCQVVGTAWWFSVVAHGAEACFATWHAQKTLKLPLRVALHWFFLIAITGYPIMQEFLELLQVDQKSKQKGAKVKSS